MNDVDFYRMIRYFTVLTFEHYKLLKMVYDKFNLPPPKDITIEEIMQNICKDFGLPYDVVLEHCKLEEWKKDV